MAVHLAGNIPAIAGILAGLLNIIAFIPYIFTTFGWSIRWNLQIYRTNQSTRPNRATWFIWAFIGVLISLSSLKSGATNTIWVPIVLTAGPLIVAIISIKYGEGGWTRFDKLCLAGAFAAVMIWLLSGSAPAALLMSIIADAFGLAPTILHAYRKPEEENKLAWTLFFLGDVANLFAVTSWSLPSFPIWIFTLYMVGHTALIVGILSLRSRKLVVSN